MNDKENELYRILDITISCCTFEDFPITREDILEKLNPTFAKEKERDTRIENLETNFNGLNDKLDQILTLINGKKNG